MAEQADELRDAAGVQPPRRRRLQAVGASVLALLVGVNVWAGWREVQTRRAAEVREQMVTAGRAGALALTTIDHNEVDRDVQRILDASTGAFRDDFAQRAEPFKAAARKAASTSVGTVRAAGLEAVDGDSARVLVALTVMTSNRGAPEQQPKSWRTRVTVTKVDDGFKVAAVEFVQ
ncbi:MAG: mammalian cell entry protein [Mycobacteriaceae bacterium]